MIDSVKKLETSACGDSENDFRVKACCVRTCIVVKCFQIERKLLMKHKICKNGSYFDWNEECTVNRSLRTVVVEALVQVTHASMLRMRYCMQ